MQPGEIQGTRRDGNQDRYREPGEIHGTRSDTGN